MSDHQVVKKFVPCIYLHQGKAVDGLTKLVHASQFKMSPKLWTKFITRLFSDITGNQTK